ncbi:hypothetical protein BKA64DRAFT_667316 [Cadophora sp. MPI-SDFR-AT-0126]|nr:hypothetical protein BKA64DRAFT_667316 [Leotiomycetes sp. MPI-SDFR-AT-0126]
MYISQLSLLKLIDHKHTVYTTENVSIANQCNLHGTIIFKHGGRQLDSAAATLDALRRGSGQDPQCCGWGIRRGADFFKAVALGALFFALSGGCRFRGLGVGHLLKRCRIVLTM